MSRTAIFPGSFDPFTLGHEDIVRRALLMFDRVIVAIGCNGTKVPRFPAERRIRWIEDVFRDCPTVSVEAYTGLTVNFCLESEATHIIRGLRSATDFDYESMVAQANQRIAPNIHTVFLLTNPEFMGISSTVVRDVYWNGGDVSGFIPKVIWEDLEILENRSPSSE